MRRIPNAARVAAVLAVTALWVSPVVAAPDKGGASAAASANATASKPADERQIDATPINKPTRGSSTGAGGRPTVRGPQLPEAVRQRLKQQLDARVDADLREVKEIREEAVQLLTTFVAETPKDSRELPEALLRLGELKWEIEREAFVARFQAWEKKPAGERGPAPDPNYGVARDLFGRVLKDYPRYPNYDLALYVDGFMATEQGKNDEAIQRFDRIIAEYPNSRFIADAHMARAEWLFGVKFDYAKALVEYEEVMKYRQSDLYGLSLFKSAWCLWRLGRTEEAAKRFVSVFEVTDDKNKTSLAQRKELDELESEALKYLVEVFTEDEKNTATDVYGFLTKIGGDRFAGKVVRALATQFYDQAHYERGIEAYELLLKLEPASPEAGDWILKIAQGYAILENYPKLKDTYARALAGYTAGSSWAKSQADPHTVEATTAAIEKQLYDNTAQVHAKAQKDKTSKTEFEGAAALYEVYLSKFDKEPRAYKAQFYVGEIDFYHLNRSTDAATHYMAAARGVPEAKANTEPDKTLRHDAIYNALAALERVRIAELEARKKQGDKAGGYQETEVDKKYAEALDLFAQLYPNDPALPERFFLQGKLYYDNGVYDPAVKIWGVLLEKFPRSQFAQGAGELILDSFNRSKNYENIETWARRLKSAPAFQSADQQKKLDVLIIQSVFKQGEQKGLANDHAGAAAAYLRAAKEFPKDQRAAQACVNAIIEGQKAHDVGTIKTAATLITGSDYATRPESPLGAWMATTAFQSMGLLTESAEAAEAMLALSDRDHPNYQKYDHVKDAAFNAVVLREALGDHDRAVADGNRYLALFPSSAEADEVVFITGKAHQNAGRNKEAADLYRRYVSRARSADKKAQGYVLLALALEKTGDEKGEDVALKEAVTLGKQHPRDLSPAGKFAVARARYMEGERVLQKFQKVEISGDVKQLQTRLKQKAELLKQASSIFLDTVSFGVAEWSTAALYQIGFTYESFAKALKESPAPAGLSDSDKEIYKQQIDEFVVPIEERSLDAYENGWKKAIELGIYNQWTAKMREALGRLNGELYPPLKEIGFDMRSQGPSQLPALLDAPKAGVVPKAAAAAPAAPAAPAAGGKK
jgi:tetratricopeptide (TPR) repeat protein